MSAWHIRVAVASDAAALAALAQRTFVDTFGADNTPEDLALHLATNYSADIQASEIADPAMTTLVVEADAVLIAYAQLRRGAAPSAVTGPAPIEIQRFYVSAGWHGRGVAQALMHRALETARAAGAETIWLGVWERNPRAIAFYRKAGYVDVGSHVFMVGNDPQTDRILTRPLADHVTFSAGH